MHAPASTRRRLITAGGGARLLTTSRRNQRQPQLQKMRARERVISFASFLRSQMRKLVVRLPIFDHARAPSIACRSSGCVRDFARHQNFWRTAFKIFGCTRRFSTIQMREFSMFIVENFLSSLLVCDDETNCCYRRLARRAHVCWRVWRRQSSTLTSETRPSGRRECVQEGVCERFCVLWPVFFVYEPS